MVIYTYITSSCVPLNQRHPNEFLGDFIHHVMSNSLLKQEELAACRVVMLWGSTGCESSLIIWNSILIILLDFTWSKCSNASRLWQVAVHGCLPSGPSWASQAVLRQTAPEGQQMCAFCFQNTARLCSRFFDTKAETIPVLVSFKKPFPLDKTCLQDCLYLNCATCLSNAESSNFSATELHMPPCR